MLQVSDTPEFIIRNIERCKTMYEACPDYPHWKPDCLRCRPFLIGMNWWLDRLIDVEKGATYGNLELS
jgi:hypothetical protein